MHAATLCSAAESYRLQWDATHRLLVCSLEVLGISPLDAPTRRVAEGFILKFLRAGSLRCCSRALAAPAQQWERGSITTAELYQGLLVIDVQAGHTLAGVAPFIPQHGVAIVPASDDASEGRPGASGGTLCRALVAELSSSGVLDHAARLVVMASSLTGGDCAVAAGGGGGAGAPDEDSRELAAAAESAAAEAFRMLSTAAEAFARATAGNRGTGATTLPPPQQLTPPWGRCTQYLTLAAAVSTLAGMGYGGGSGDDAVMGGDAPGDDGPHCRGTYGLPRVLARALWAAAAPDSHSVLETERVFAVLLSMVEAEVECAAGATRLEDRPGGGGGAGGGEEDAGDGGGGGTAGDGWSFLVGPRAAHVMCMRIADLAVASGEAAAAAAKTATAAGGGSPNLHPPPLLHPRCARHLAARALAAAQCLLLGPLTAGRQRRTRGADVPAAAGDATAAAAAGGTLPVAFWDTVVRALRVPVASAAAPASSSAAVACDGCDLASIRRLPGAGLGGMLAVPGLGAGGSLPSAALTAPALACGLLPALECCARALGRSSDPRDVESLCELLKGLLLEQPGGLATVLAFGPPGQAASLLTSLAKVLHRCAEAAEAEADTPAGGRGPSVPPPSLPEGDGGCVRANLADLVALLGRALSVVCTDQWVAAVATATLESTDTHAMLQLRRLLSLMLQRWLPALARAVALAPGLPRLPSGTAAYSAAQDSLSGLAIALFASADPPALKALTQSARVMYTMRWSMPAFEIDVVADDGGAYDAGSGQSGVGGYVGDVRWEVYEEVETAAAAAGLLHSETGTSWDAAHVRALLHCLLAAAIAQSEQLRRMVGASAAEAVVAEVAAPPPGQPPEMLFLEQRSREVRSLSCVRADPALSVYASTVFQTVRGICSKDFTHYETAAFDALCDSRALMLLRLAVMLAPPAGEVPGQPAEGLPPACANPRCTNLAGKSDEGLMAAAAQAQAEVAGGGVRDGGGSSSDEGGGGDNVGGRRVSLWCTAECQRASANERQRRPVPPDAFAAHWLAPGATRGLNLKLRRQLLCLMAASGMVANLEVALRPELDVASSRDVHNLASCAAHGCDVPTGGVPLDAAAGAREAACNGHLHVLAWLVETFGVGAVGIGPYLLAAAAASGSVELMAWLCELRAAGSGCEEAVEWLVAQG
ncbi:hypothetical protein GPECTOR_67g294 [Gonium pectorale]|uniref:Uncharacterized protein n=1 Tax=Gonium pectorale TaxID=33097 RepID=A0A150G3Q8_GONPE|nr:hypothetical protein GPECTOR_67g294 [Gonium pectorale]|eukprot:KXZ44454.1 hypothetical protein GPECTOR_67g294 [Gonium pectorale]